MILVGTVLSKGSADPDFKNCEESPWIRQIKPPVGGHSARDWGFERA
jgi:hypothetical protein